MREKRQALEYLDEMIERTPATQVGEVPGHPEQGDNVRGTLMRARNYVAEEIDTPDSAAPEGAVDKALVWMEGICCSALLPPPALWVQARTGLELIAAARAELAGRGQEKEE